LLSKIIGDDESDIVARGEITGKGIGSSGHIDCSGLLISPKAKIDSIPRISALTPDTSLTHEASLGKIGEDQIQYLKSRGLNENEARNLIISGFLEADTSQLPPELAEETRKLIMLASKAKG
jgi:Fe-S cluster assembly scaffold protein SufB